ncbi:MAG: MBL fold metallo-hydrolase [Phycisphaerales bacterium]|nr:MBL fold metallo-hydrolase [Phycisphaerales bacterium]
MSEPQGTSRTRTPLRDAARVLRQWPPIVAETMGWRDPEPMVPAAGPLPHPDFWKRTDLGATWLGQATTIIRLGPLTILTDPVLEERIGIRIGGRTFGRRRSTALPDDLHHLPTPDLVLLTHAHMDHWDRRTLRRLAHPRTTVIVPPRTARLLPRGFGHVHELAWHQAVTLEGVHIEAMRPNHWGARFVFDRRRGYNAYILRHDTATMLFAGDTAHTDAFDHLDDIDVAVLGIGNSYEPWDRYHATPEQAAAMATAMNARLLMPIHHSTFRDPVEPLDEPLERLRRVWDAERLICARIGETWGLTSRSLTTGRTTTGQG